MRKQISLRLSDAAVARLDGFVKETGLSRARVVERMILRPHERYVIPDDAKAVPEDPAETVRETFEMVPPSAKEHVKKKVQDLSATKQVLRRKINPMTGKSYGPVPKS